MPLPEVGQPIRRSPPLLSDTEIADVVAYLAPLTDGPSIPEVTSVSTDLARGRQVYVASCAACHGATGAGDAIAGGILAPNLRQSTPQDVAEALVGGPPPMPRFSFSPDDRDALIAYVEYLRNPPNPGGASLTDVGPVAEGFVAGFIGLVVLVLLVHWTARTKRVALEAPVPAEQQPYSGEDES
jgi:ubiquinol-cytochrome c reductase cytochrome c subunit